MVPWCIGPPGFCLDCFDPDRSSDSLEKSSVSSLPRNSLVVLLSTDWMSCWGFLVFGRTGEKEENIENPLSILRPLGMLEMEVLSGFKRLETGISDS